MSELVRIVAASICKSRTCEGINCCQWPANGGRHKCPVEAGGYDDAAKEAIAIIDAYKTAEKRKNCRHYSKVGSGSLCSDGSSSYHWFCAECGTSGGHDTPAFAPAERSTPQEKSHGST